MNGDITVLNEHLYGTAKLPVQARTTSTHAASIKPGEPVEKGVTGAVAQGGNYMVLALDTSPKDGTNLLMGVCKEESNETVAADGTGVFYLLGLGSRIRGKAKTTTNVNTVAKFALLVLDCVFFDGIATKAASTTTTPYTIDESAGDDANVNGIQMLQCDIVTGLIEARVVGGLQLIGGGI